MKHLFLTLALCITTLSWAQNQIPLQRTVSVYGHAIVDSKNKLYKNKVILSLDNNYYAETPCISIEELKTKYFAELKKRNVDTSKFTEDPMAYAGMSYRKEGVVLHFITDDKDEMLQVSSYRMPQISTSYLQTKSVISSKVLDTLLAEAFKDAHEKAEMLSKQVNAKVGKVVTISSYNYPHDSRWRTSTDTPEKISVSVVYELLD